MQTETGSLLPAHLLSSNGGVESAPLSRLSKEDGD